MDNLLYAAYFAVGMFVAGLNAKALGVSILYGLGMVAIYPNGEAGAMLFVLYIPAVILASFRE
jgi:hypothetical protein